MGVVFIQDIEDIRRFILAQKRQEEFVDRIIEKIRK